MVADIEELEEMDASEVHARRLNAKEVLTPQRSGNFMFPVAGEEQRPGASGTRRRTRNLFKESSPTPLQEDSTRYDEEAKVEFWTIVESKCTSTLPEQHVHH